MNKEMLQKSTSLMMTTVNNCVNKLHNILFILSVLYFVVNDECVQNVLYVLLCCIAISEKA